MEVHHRPAQDAGRIAFLDCLRIFAFVSVLVGHKFYPQLQTASADDSVHVTLRYLAQLALPFCQGGGAGVVVFFLVSGYIIAHVLRSERAAEFAVKRVFRIYPLFVAAVLTEYAVGARPDAPQSPRDWILQLLLLGDFASLPYALGGVEWTLRIEVLFYVYMGVLRAVGLLDRSRALPVVLAVTVAALGLLAPLPATGGPLFVGCYSIYAPFLLLGVAFRLKEAGEASGTFLFGLTMLVFGQYFALVARHQPHWMGSHFAALAFGLFAASWLFRRHVVATPLVLLGSDLTYGVYAFHNWAYERIRDAVPHAPGLSPEVAAVVGLFAVCALANRCVERPGVRHGRAVLKRLPRRGPMRLVVRRLPVGLNLSRPVGRL